MFLRANSVGLVAVLSRIPGSEVTASQEEYWFGNLRVAGVSAGKVSSVVDLMLQLKDDAEINIEALIVKRVTKGDFLACGKESVNCSHVPGLLGSNILPQLLLGGFAGKKHFLAQNTRLGWIVFVLSELSTSKMTSTHLAPEEFEQK